MNGNAHVIAVETQERGPMPAILPLWMCATEQNSDTVQRIIEAGCRGTAREWLSVASMFSGAPRIVAAVVEPRSPQHWEDGGRDIRWHSIWEWMVQSGLFEMGELLSECDRIKTTQGAPGSESHVLDVDKVKAFLLSSFEGPKHNIPFVMEVEPVMHYYSHQI